MRTTRREFLGFSATTILASGLSLPRFLTRTAGAAMAAPPDDRILVVVQLSGGNDGLNTVIPYRDDLYHAARPTLRVAEDRVLRLNDSLGLHPELAGLKRLHDDGMLSVITNVGYPNPDRSHFRSMDIWHTASESPEGFTDGWLGRFVDRRALPGEPPMAINISDESLPLALRARDHAVPSVRNIDAFRLDDRARDLEGVIAAERKASDDLLFVQRVAVQSCQCAARLEHVEHAQGEGSYPGLGLADRLRQIATLIGAGFGARIYYTSLGGFDTHAKQAISHGALLRELGDSVAAFIADLKARGMDDRVLVMTFSEFGRRVRENGSFGTDHGAAAPMFIAGRACRAGVVGGAPDLSDLTDGDVRHDTDFREVYASVLDDWLGIDHAAILGRRYQPRNIVGS